MYFLLWCCLQFLIGTHLYSFTNELHIKDPNLFIPDPNKRIPEPPINLISSCQNRNVWFNSNHIADEYINHLRYLFGHNVRSFLRRNVRHRERRCIPPKQHRTFVGHQPGTHSQDFPCPTLSSTQHPILKHADNATYIGSDCHRISQPRLSGQNPYPIWTATVNPTTHGSGWPI